MRSGTWSAVALSCLVLSALFLIGCDGTPQVREPQAPELLELSGTVHPTSVTLDGGTVRFGLEVPLDVYWRVQPHDVEADLSVVGLPEDAAALAGRTVTVTGRAIDDAGSVEATAVRVGPPAGGLLPGVDPPPVVPADSPEDKYTFIGTVDAAGQVHGDRVWLRSFVLGGPESATGVQYFVADGATSITSAWGERQQLSRFDAPGDGAYRVTVERRGDIVHAVSIIAELQ